MMTHLARIGQVRKANKSYIVFRNNTIDPRIFWTSIWWFTVGAGQSGLFQVVCGVFISHLVAWM